MSRKPISSSNIEKIKTIARYHGVIINLTLLYYAHDHFYSGNNLIIILFLNYIMTAIKMEHEKKWPSMVC